MSRPIKYDQFRVDMTLTTPKAYTEDEISNILDTIFKAHTLVLRGAVTGVRRKTNTKLKNDR